MLRETSTLADSLLSARPDEQFSTTSPPGITPAVGLRWQDRLMPPRRRAPAPIPVDIEGVRRKLAEGRIVRVGISKSAQFPDGATGRVRHVGDPAVDGEEFVQVELSLNGTRDILPFTPADLTPVTRGRPAGSASTAASAGAGKPAVGVRANGRSALTRSSTLTSVPVGNGQQVSSRSVPADSAAPGGSAVAASAQLHFAPDTSAGSTDQPPGAETTVGAAVEPSGRGVRQSPTSTPTPAESREVSSLPVSDQLPAAGATSRAKPSRGNRRTPAVAITIATTDTEPTQWKIEARVGARVALRSGSVAPARVWELVRLLENEALTKAVGSILDDQRKAAQARADILAAELAQVRAELDALPDGSN
ncbi:MAG: hypothetical protein ABJD68_01180 [Nakamurella sp.]